MELNGTHRVLCICIRHEADADFAMYESFFVQNVVLLVLRYTGMENEWKKTNIGIASTTSKTGVNWFAAATVAGRLSRYCIDRFHEREGQEGGGEAKGEIERKRGNSR